MYRGKLFGLLICTLLISSSALGTGISLEHVDGLLAPDTIQVDREIVFYLHITNGDDAAAGITNGYRVYSPDGATWTSTLPDTIGTLGGAQFDGGFFLNKYSDDGMGADTVGFGGIRFFGTGLPANYDSVAYAIRIGPVPADNHGKTICLDSSYYPPAGRWKWAASDHDIYPTWDGPHCFAIKDVGDPPPPDTMINVATWPVDQGGNGHTYGVIPRCVSWVEADSIARSIGTITLVYPHLATVTSQAENDFIFNNVLAGLNTDCYNEMFWLGGRDSSGWHWTTGEPWAYTNWAPGEPNNPGSETALNMWGPYASRPGEIPSKWNNSRPADGPDGLHRYWAVVEISSMGPPPDTSIIPTDKWISIYCEHAFIDDEILLSEGDIITAYDPDGVKCGQDTVGPGGKFGFMPIYADDQFTDRDEGCMPGDLIQFKINGRPVFPVPRVYWTQRGDYFEVCSFSSGTCHTYDMRPGWYLISWNVDYLSSIEDFLAPIADDVDVVLGFDQGGLMYVPSLPQFGTLHDVDYYHGYWIRVTRSVTLDVCGYPVHGPFEGDYIPIYAGWNLVSYWPGMPMSPFWALEEIIYNLQVAYGFDGGMEVFVPEDTLFNTLHEMKPQFGYWIQSDAGAILRYMPNDCTSVANVPLPVSKVQALTPTRQFMAVYGERITLDGKELEEGATVSVLTAEDVLCGQGTYSEQVLRFTPVYGADIDNRLGYPKAGDELNLRVNGVDVNETVTWTERGDRVALASLTTGGLTPDGFQLSQNYPNPFNPQTSIGFNLPSAGHVTLKVYNILGQEVAVLVDGELTAGPHQAVWDGTDESGQAVTSGVYFYRITTESASQTRKMLLMK